MKLYDVHASPNCKKVRVVARELGLSLEIVPVSFAATKEPQYLVQNPTGKVPTLVDDDGFTLWESGAILTYLADKRPELGLLPTPPRARANVMRWLFFIATHVQPWVSLLGQERIIKARSGTSPDPSLVALAERDLARFLAVVEQQLAGAPYLAGAYTIADIALGAGLEGAEARGLSLEPYPHLTAWRDRLRSRPAWQD